MTSAPFLTPATEPDRPEIYSLDVGACGIVGDSFAPTAPLPPVTIAGRALAWLAATTAAMGAALGIEADDL